MTEEPVDAPTGSDDASPAPPHPEPKIPLREIDAALSPLRRALRFGSQNPAALPPFFGDNALRALKALVESDRQPPVPPTVTDFYGVQRDALTALDDADPETISRQLSNAYAYLSRLDALYGLPARRSFRPARKRHQRDKPESSKPSEHRDKKEAKPTKPVAKAAAEPLARPKAIRLSDPLSDHDVALAAQLEPVGITTILDLLLLPWTELHTVEPVGGRKPAELSGEVAFGGRCRLHWTTIRKGKATQSWSALSGSHRARVCWRQLHTRPPLEARVHAVGTVASPATYVDAEGAFPSEDGRTRLPSYGHDERDVSIRRLWHRVAMTLDARGEWEATKKTTTSWPFSLANLVRCHAAPAEETRDRMARFEAFMFQAAALSARWAGAKKRGSPLPVIHGFAGRLRQIFDLQLNDAQQRCMEHIKRDLRRTLPMRRVLTGEVNGGKGLVALLACAMVAEGRSQVLVLCEDEKAAARRHLLMEPLLRENGHVSRVLSDEPSKAQRDALGRGEIHVLFATPQGLRHDLAFRRLGLVVSFEDRHWGAAAAHYRGQTGSTPNHLVVPTVPVGPSILATAYADYDLSLLEHPDRRPAAIHVLGADARSEAYERVRAAVASGLQAVVAFPLVDGSDALNRTDAERVVSALHGAELKGLRVGLLHGSMSPEDQRSALADAVHRRFDVLVTTTPLEDAPAIPGVGALIVEQAESVCEHRLHRMIGQLSLAPSQAFACLVVGELADEVAHAAIRHVAQAPTGFALTEGRVQPEMIATGSPPRPSTAWFDFAQHALPLIDARTSAADLLRDDPQLRKGPNRELMHAIAHLWQKFWPEASDDWTPPSIERSQPNRRRRRRKRT